MIEGFNAALDERGIKADPTQQAAALRLQKFYDDLIAFKAARRSKLRKLLIHQDLPRGVYFWGGVGRGKSFLMDCFFAAVPYDRKRRVHFDAFMREIHAMLKSLRNESDPLARVAEQIADRTRLMCFDEFHISDIADALILGRLMRAFCRPLQVLGRELAVLHRAPGVACSTLPPCAQVSVRSTTTWPAAIGASKRMLPGAGLRLQCPERIF